MTASGGHITQVIHEAIDAVAAPDVRARIISRALFVAGLDQIPERGPPLREFVDRFLRQAVAASLGDANADHVSQCLEPIVKLVEQADAVARTDPRPPELAMEMFAEADRLENAGFERDRLDYDGHEHVLDPEPIRLPDIELEHGLPTLDLDLEPVHSAPTRIPQTSDVTPMRPRRLERADYEQAVVDDPLGLELAGPLELPEPIDDELLYETGQRRISRRARKPLVLVASRDGTSVHQLMGLFHGNALLVHVDDAFTLLAALQEEGARPDVVVVDCRSPSLQPATLAALAPDLPKNAFVLLWGGDEDVRAQLRSLGARIEQWQTCDGVATPEDVANACLALVS